MRFRRRNLLLALLALPVLVAGLFEWHGRRQATKTARERHPGCEAGEQFQLRDGRRLGYRVVGDPSGRPVFFFHSALGSRLEWPVSGDAVRAAHVYLVAVDRPGYGCSDPQSGRTLGKWVEDIEQFTSFLRWRTFRIIGWSAGVPHALAVARWMPGRVESLDLIGSSAPPDAIVVRPPFGFRVVTSIAAWLPGITWHLASMYRDIVLKDPDRAEADMLEGLSAAEKREVQQPEVARHLRVTHREAMRYSAIGTLEDLRTVGSEWGFAVQSVETPVRLWHGRDDSLAPFANAQAVAERTPGAALIARDNEGHFLIYRHEAAILRGQAPAD